MTEEIETDIDRRSFLKQSAVGAFGVGGVATQDEPNRFRATRRMAFDYPERLGDSLRQKIVLLTDKTDDDPDVSEIDTCEFSNWPPDELTIWEGILVEWDGSVQGFFGTNPDVRAEQLVERKQIFVDEQDTPPELGTPYIISGLVECPEGFAGVTATQIPGIDIKTGPGVSTGDSDRDLPDQLG
ncbi:hypothetical protein [Halorussus lipolyticus]|uniref:hypothetical protein n=1 Tax=Halorussus lipolyticus TaxID=3034024 RepID=UPI0023E7DA93|nr:hypothetical protein [Halorussus sp. DT80]